MKMKGNMDEQDGQDFEWIPENSGALGQAPSPRGSF